SSTCQLSDVPPHLIKDTDYVPSGSGGGVYSMEGCRHQQYPDRGYPTDRYDGNYPMDRYGSGGWSSSSGGWTDRNSYHPSSDRTAGSSYYGDRYNTGSSSDRNYYGSSTSRYPNGDSYYGSGGNYGGG